MSRRRFVTTLVPVLFLAGAVLAGCGDDVVTPDVTSTVSSDPATTAPSSSAPSSSAPSSSSPASSAPASSAAATTEPITTPPSSTAAPSTAPVTSLPNGLEQPAIWPAADIAFATPEQAAEDFVAQVLGVPPELGEFMAGDNRSGEIEVFSPGEGGPGSRVVRSLLLLRRLGPDGGWFVTAAIADGVTITEPEQGATLPAGEFRVSGLGRGFEATIIVKAVAAGDPTPLVEPVIAAGGALETPEPYAATLDLSDIATGTTVMILVRGDTGLETDPGEFSAIAVTVG